MHFTQPDEWLQDWLNNQGKNPSAVNPVMPFFYDDKKGGLSTAAGIQLTIPPKVSTGVYEVDLLQGRLALYEREVDYDQLVTEIHPTRPNAAATPLHMTAGLYVVLGKSRTGKSTAMYCLRDSLVKHQIPFVRVRVGENEYRALPPSPSNFALPLVAAAYFGIKVVLIDSLRHFFISGTSGGAAGALGIPRDINHIFDTLALYAAATGTVVICVANPLIAGDGTEKGVSAYSLVREGIIGTVPALMETVTPPNFLINQQVIDHSVTTSGRAVVNNPHRPAGSSAEHLTLSFRAPIVAPPEYRSAYERFQP